MQSEMSGITKLHKQRGPLTRKTRLRVIIPNVSRPLFSRQMQRFSHTWMNPTLERGEENKKIKQNKEGHEENTTIMSFSLHITSDLILRDSNSSSQTSRTQVPPRQSLRSIAPLACDGQCLPRP